MSQYEFTYPSVTSSEEKMLDDVLEVLLVSEIPADLRNRFTLAVSEAFTNALIHGNEGDPHKQVKLLLDIKSDSLAADIIDEGQGGLEKVAHKRPPTTLSENGRGVDLMRYYASDMSFTETEHGGLKVSIRFERMKESNVQRFT